MPDAIYLPGLRRLTLERIQWNGKNRMEYFTDGSKLGESKDAGVFCGKLGPHFSAFQAEIFAIFKVIEPITGGHTSDSESFMIFVDDQAALNANASI